MLHVTKQIEKTFKPFYYPLMNLFTCKMCKMSVRNFLPIIVIIVNLLLWSGFINPFVLHFLGMDLLKVSFVGQIVPMRHLTIAKSQKNSVLNGSATGGESCSPVLFLRLVSGQLRHYTTSAVLYNSRKASSTFNLNHVTLVSMTLGQKSELQYLNTPWPFTCKLNSAPLAETNYSQLLVAGHEWAS